MSKVRSLCMPNSSASLRADCAGIAASVVLSIYVLPANAQPIFPGLPSCQLSTPPKNASVVPTYGVDVLYYPPRLAIAANFTGCQSTWFGDSRYLAKAHLLQRAFFENGELKSVWVLEPETPVLHCQYYGGALIKPSPPPDACPASRDLPSNWQRARK